MSQNFLADVQQGIVNVILADPDNAGLQVVTGDSDDIKETASVYVTAEVDRELVPLSRIFILDGQIFLRVNRSVYTTDELSALQQNLLASVLNPCSEGDYSVFSHESAMVHGFLLGAQNITISENIQVESFSFKLWASQQS